MIKEPTTFLNGGSNEAKCKHGFHVDKDNQLTLPIQTFAYPKMAPYARSFTLINLWNSVVSGAHWKSYNNCTCWWRWLSLSCQISCFLSLISYFLSLISCFNHLGCHQQKNDTKNCRRKQKKHINWHKKQKQTKRLNKN